MYHYSVRNNSVQGYTCLQVGSSSSGSIQIGNATVVSADIGAVNGVVHIVDKFPLLNAALNTSIIAALEAAGDFGPFNAFKVMGLASLHLLQPRAQPWVGSDGSWCGLIDRDKAVSQRQQHTVAVGQQRFAAALCDTQPQCYALC